MGRTKIFGQTSLGRHPLVKQRYQGREEKLEHVLPTQAPDDVLSSLSVQGKSVLHEEKQAFLLHAQRRSSQEPGYVQKAKNKMLGIVSGKIS